MDVLDYCLKMEQDGEKFYRDMADKCQLPGMKKILNMMANDEVEHQNYFKNLKQKAQTKYSKTTIISESKNVFQEMKDRKDILNLEGTNVDLLKEAHGVELKSEAFYREKAAELDNDEAKKLLNNIADEEKKHAELLTNLIEFVSKPDIWIENAEFNHIEDY